MDIRRNDTVQIISGNDKGKVGRVLSVSKDKNRLVVEGVRMIKRHTKPNANNQQGGIMEREGAIHVSNVMVVCSKTGNPTRIRHTQLDNGKYVRVSARSGEMIEAK